MIETEDKKIIVLRNKLSEKLKNYQGKEKIKLDIPKYLLEKILFIDNVYKYKYLAMDFDLIKKLDLTGVSFEKVKVTNLNFDNSYGVCLNPQTVYDKDLQYTTLNGVTFIGSFDEAKIVGANFKGSKNVFINPQTIYLKNFMGTVLSDVTFTGSFDDTFILKADFTGSKNAYINIEKLFDRDLCGTNLTDTVVTDSLEDIFYDRNSVLTKKYK